MDKEYKTLVIAITIVSISLVLSLINLGIRIDKLLS